MGGVQCVVGPFIAGYTALRRVNQTIYATVGPTALAFYLTYKTLQLDLPSLLNTTEVKLPLPKDSEIKYTLSLCFNSV